MLAQEQEQFQTLPEKLQKTLEENRFYDILKALEREFDVYLFSIVMRVLRKEIALSQVSDILQKEGQLLEKEARDLSSRMQDQIFSLAFPQDSSASKEKMQKPTAQFVMYHEDEEEIRKIKERAKPLEEVQKFYDLGGAADEVVKEIAAGMSEIKEIADDSVLNKRLKNIIVSRFKDIRDDIETEHALLRSQKIGGLGISEEAAEDILKRIHSKTQHLNDYLTKFLVDEENREEKKEEEKAKEKEKTIFSKPQAVPEKMPIALQPPPPMVIPSAPVRSNRAEIIGRKQDNIRTRQQDNKTTQEQGDIQTRSNNMPAVARAAGSRTSVESIRFQPRLVGPIEELRQLTLVDFRQLSPDPKEAAKKVFERVRLLEEESFSKRAQGIKAWQESEVNSFYVRIGRESLERGVLTKALMEEKMQKGEQTLTVDEFEAILDLNQLLRE